MARYRVWSRAYWRCIGSAHTLLVLFLMLAAASPSALERSLPDVVADVKPSVVGIGTHLATRRPPAVLMGTGFVLGDGDLVATNHHVVPKTLDKKHLARILHEQ